jgi:hypothetical protein
MDPHLAQTAILLLIRPSKSVAPSHPFRDRACEMDGARCFSSGAGSIELRKEQFISRCVTPGTLRLLPAYLSDGEVCVEELSATGPSLRLSSAALLHCSIDRPLIYPDPGCTLSGGRANASC